MFTKYYDFVNETLNSYNESSNSTYSSGCVMLFFDFPEMKQIHDAIDDAHVIEFEDEPHVTLLYGLDEQVTLDEVKEKLDKIQFGTIQVYNVSLFENDNDVLKFDVKYPTRGGAFLHKGNSLLRELPYESDYDEYLPHMTICYLEKGTGKTYCDNMKDLEFTLKPQYAVFSQPDGTKTKIQINVA